MVTQPTRSASDANSLQDVELPRVQGPAKVTVQDEGGGRRFSLRLLRVHYRHVQAGDKRSEGCGFCRNGLEGVMEAASTQRGPIRAEPLVEDRRADPEESAPPARDSGSDNRQGEMLWSGV